jgi:hypothetical protein
MREQFAQMYEKHDVLAEALEKATGDFGSQGLPRASDKGSLDIKQVDSSINEIFSAGEVRGDQLLI